MPDEKGEFVLYFKEIVKGTADIILEIKGEGIEKMLSASIEEGQSNVYRSHSNSLNPSYIRLKI